MCESVLLDLSGDHSVPCIFPRGTLLEPVGDGDQPFKRGVERPDLSDPGSNFCVRDAERDARASGAIYLCVVCRRAQLLSELFTNNTQFIKIRSIGGGGECRIESK